MIFQYPLLHTQTHTHTNTHTRTIIHTRTRTIIHTRTHTNTHTLLHHTARSKQTRISRAHRILFYLILSCLLSSLIYFIDQNM